jgi:hypothetical protein
MSSRRHFATPAQNPSHAMVAGAEGYTFAASVWALRLAQAPFSVAPTPSPKRAMRVHRRSAACRRLRPQEERRGTLESLLQGQQVDRNQAKVPDLEALNKMIARDDDEVALFSKLDRQLVWPQPMLSTSEMPTWMQVRPRTGDATSSLGDAESSLGDAKILLGDAKSSLGDAKSSLGDAKSSLGDAKGSLGDAKSSLGDAKILLGDAKSSLGEAKSLKGDN